MPLCCATSARSTPSRRPPSFPALASARAARGVAPFPVHIALAAHPLGRPSSFGARVILLFFWQEFCGRCGSAIWLPHRHMPFRIFRGSANHNHMTASSFIPRATSFSSIKLRRATHIPISDILDFPECCSSLSILVPIPQHRVSNDGKKYQFPIDMFLISYLHLYPHLFTHISSRHRHFRFTYVRQRDERISKSSAISDYAGD
ncbi:hypothetical protein B0H16DRAFT_390807 [Mycena metata]|uniref:Uncharacterized protein n=1 Tax=Mycena metata TaxID=1033252 RepID=A0AAD7MK75_9AGAR|nr:hypothetical protein B0H16DRAFT_390807 [Mycena metata]